MSNRFTSRLTDNDDFKRDELIRKIEHAVEHMTLSELEALSYDMFTKGYIGSPDKLGGKILNFPEKVIPLCHE